MQGLLIRVSLVGIAIAASARCDDSTTLVLEPNPAVTVFIDASKCPRIPACSRCQLEYEGFDKNGKPAPFPTLIWSSENPSVATVNQSGRVDGWRAGNATIAVEVLETGASDQETVEILPSSSHVTCTPPNEM